MFLKDRSILFLATGCGCGNASYMPGTVGSLAALPLIAGCWTLSVNPLYTEADVLPHGAGGPALAGLWGDPTGEDPETWEFTPGEIDGSYRLVVREKRDRRSRGGGR